MSVSAEMISQVAIWREKARQGTLTQDEMRSAIAFLRAERTAMQPTKTKSKASPVDQTSLMNELDLL